MVRALLVGSALAVASPLAVGGAQQAYSVQMHVHGSMSELQGSFDSGTWEAANAGVDVIWWSDHDWRITYYNHVTNFSFEDWNEPIPTNEAWTSVWLAENSLLKEWVFKETLDVLVANASISTEQASQGTSSLKLSAQGSQPTWGNTSYYFKAHRNRERRSLASVVTVTIDIFADIVGPDARPFLDFELSQHANNPMLNWDTYRIRYYLDNSGAQPFLAGATYNVPIAYTPGAWNALTLNVSDDAVVGFPFIDGEDNSIYRVTLGIEARNNATCTAYFDNYQVSHLVEGQALFDKGRVMMDALEVLEPAVKHVRGTEISGVGQHLNEFSVNTVLFDYDAMEDIPTHLERHKEGTYVQYSQYTNWANGWVVEQVHNAGGLVSYNHAFGATRYPAPQTPTPPQLLAMMQATEAYGCDIYEVYRQRGYDTTEFLWVWDELAKGGLYMLANGVSDTHGGAEGHWLTMENNFHTWVYADSTSKADLLEGMKAGRMYFGDISKFDGTVDVTSARGFRMGQMVVTDRSGAAITLDIDGITANSDVTIVEYGTETQTWNTSGPTVSFQKNIPISQADGTFVRFNVVETSGTRPQAVYSNPLYFLRTIPLNGIRAQQAAIDLGDVRSTEFTNFHLMGAIQSTTSTDNILTLSGDATAGRIVLEYADVAKPTDVTFSGGLTGTSTYLGTLLTLDSLQGSGSVEVRAPGPCEADVNADGVVDVADIAYVIFRLGSTAADSGTNFGDADGNGSVDTSDIIFVIFRLATPCN